jgi:hypothetical protein
MPDQVIDPTMARAVQADAAKLHILFAMTLPSIQTKFALRDPGLASSWPRNQAVPAAALGVIPADQSWQAPFVRRTLKPSDTKFHHVEELLNFFEREAFRADRP